MRILIDTDIALWATLKTDALSPIAKDFLLSSGNEIFYSVISIWEVSLKHSINPENMEITASEFRQLCQDSGFIEIPLEYHHILGLDRLTQKEGCPVHKDPNHCICYPVHLFTAAAPDLVCLLRNPSALPPPGEMFHYACFCV